MEKGIFLSSLVLLTLTFAAFFGVYWEYGDADREKTLVENVQNVPEVIHTQASTPILFVGDIMLGRAVETFIETSTSSPFEYVSGLLSEPNITVGNFEGVVSEVHEHAPSMTFRFSIKDEYLGILKTKGFDVLSFSNNHSLDYGTTSLAYTRTRCGAYGLICAGSPLNRDEYVSHVVEQNGLRVGFLFLHTLYGGVSTTTFATALDTLTHVSDVQFAYIHWGDEYVLTHNSAQEELAHLLIDSGVDAVVGHHPHVVQDIELYKGKPIFYSLGNFIFDQYFDTNVQEMLALHVHVSDTSLTYSTIPLTTTQSRMQPQTMSDEAKRVLFERIFTSIAEIQGVDRHSGIIIVPR